MTCKCGNDNAMRWRMYEDGTEACNICGRVGSVTVPDVYFDKPYLDRNLVDVHKPEQKDGVWIESRRQKAEIMSRLGVREAGDKVRGCRVEDKHAQRRERERFGS